MKNCALIFLFAYLGTIVSIAVAAPSKEEECPIGAMSNAARYECLSRNLEALDMKLRNDVALIVKNLPKSGLWGDFPDTKYEKNFYGRRTQAITSADRQWRKFSEAECSMAAGVYEGGSGEPTAAIECRIEMIKERLQHLKSREPYKSFRKNDG